MQQVKLFKGIESEARALENEVNAWIKHVTDIKPCVVQLTSESKSKDKGQKPITKTRMTQIAELVTEKTGIPVEVAGA